MRRLLFAVLAAFVVGFLVAFGLAALGGSKGADLGGLQIWLPMLAGVLAMVVVLVSGNRRVPTAGPAEAEAAATMTPDPDAARLYVYRDGFVGSALGTTIFVEGRSLTQIRGGRYAATTLSPEPHRIELKATVGDKVAAIDIHPAAGEIVALRAFMELGALVNTPALERNYDLAEVAAKLRRLKLVRNDPA